MLVVLDKFDCSCKIIPLNFPLCHSIYFHFEFNVSLIITIIFLFLTGLCVPTACSQLGGGGPTQNREYRKTILCTFMIVYLLPRLSMSLVSCYYASSLPKSSFPPSSSTAAAVSALYTTRSRSFFSNHLFATHVTSISNVSLQMSIIGRVTMYCATVFFLFSTYPPISSNPASCIAVSSGG